MNVQNPNTRFRSGCARLLWLSAACCGALCAPLAADVEYDFFLVESFNPDYNLAETFVVDINNSNIGLGSDTFGAFIWKDAEGKIQLPFSGVKSLNNLGWVNYGHVLYHPDTQQEIPIPAPSAGYPTRSLRELNDNMIGVGVAVYHGPGCEPFNCPYDCGRNFIWDEIDGSRHIDVSNLKAFHAVNNNNIAVGVIIINCDDTRGIVYDLNTDVMINLSELLPPLDLLGIPAQIWPTDINNAGQVIGTAVYGSEPQKTFVWSQSEGFTFLPTIPGGEYGYMYVNSINNHGVVVGEALDYVDMEWKAFIWDSANGMRMLEDLVDEPTNFMVENVYAINDNGWITGSGHFGPGWATQRGYVLKPKATTPTGDLNGDGVVNVSDLLLLLGDWGACAGCSSCAADMNDDCAVNVSDLLILLSNWGSTHVPGAQPCPDQSHW